MLYASTSSPSGRCRNGDFGAGRIDNGHELKENIHQGKPRADGVASGSSSTTPRSIHDDEENDDDELDPYAGLFDDEQKRVLEIK